VPLDRRRLESQVSIFVARTNGTEMQAGYSPSLAIGRYDEQLFGNRSDYKFVRIARRLD
jgi:hypothetical protein